MYTLFDILVLILQKNLKHKLYKKKLRYNCNYFYWIYEMQGICAISCVPLYWRSSLDSYFSRETSVSFSSLMLHYWVTSSTITSKDKCTWIFPLLVSCIGTIFFSCTHIHTHTHTHTSKNFQHDYSEHVQSLLCLELCSYTWGVPEDISFDYQVTWNKCHQDEPPWLTSNLWSQCNLSSRNVG